MDDFKKIILESFKSENKNVNNELKRTKQKIKSLKEQLKNTNENFKDNLQLNLKGLKDKEENLTAQKNGRLVFNINGEKIKIKKDYLKKFENPENIVKGYYYRKIRNLQKKAYKTKDYKSVQSISKLLKKQGEKQGLTKNKLTRAKNKEYKMLKQYFDLKNIDFSRQDNDKESETNYKIIVTEKDSGEIDILFI